jgi:hypothetical protein
MPDDLTTVPPARPHRARRIVLVAAILVAVVGLAGVVWGLVDRGGPPSPPPVAAVSADPAPSLAGTSPAPRSSPPPDPTGAPLPASQPVSIAIPAITVSAPVRPVGLNRDGTLEVPPLSMPNLTGWYRYGPTPGQVGPSVIVGHVDSAANGPSVFFRLGSLKPGDAVRVTRADSSVAVFDVLSVHEYPKDAFPTDDVYGAIDYPGLRLITCGGRFDASTGNYVDNIVVYARLA